MKSLQAIDGKEHLTTFGIHEVRVRMTLNLDLLQRVGIVNHWLQRRNQLGNQISDRRSNILKRIRYFSFQDYK